MSKISISELNELPETIRNYIYELEQMCDPANLIQTNMQLREENIGLRQLIQSLHLIEALKGES